MATRYAKGSKIDPELRGTVDFDFFESEDFDKADSGSGPGEQVKQKDEDYYYDDDDSFESDDETESKDSKVEKKVETEQTKNEVKAKEEPRKVKRSPSPSPERSDSPTPRAAETKSKPSRKRRDSDVSSSGSDITEVSPLGSRDASPKRSARDQTKSKHTKSKKKEKVKIVEEQDGDLNMDVLMETIMKMEKDRAQHQKKNVMFIPPGDPSDRRDSTDKNYSFEKQKLDDIERENHRLLHKILNQHQRKNRPQGLSTQYAIPPCRRQFHSALNRQKEQRRIEEENMRILHRLQTVRPSKDVSRHELLSDTKKQAMYGIPVHSMKQRRHSDSSSKTFDESFEEGEWKGETQVSRTEQQETNSKSNTRTKRKSSAKRPVSGRRPEWTDRW